MKKDSKKILVIAIVFAVLMIVGGCAIGLNKGSYSINWCGPNMENVNGMCVDKKDTTDPDNKDPSNPTNPDNKDTTKDGPFPCSGNECLKYKDGYDCIPTAGGNSMWCTPKQLNPDGSECISGKETECSYGYGGVYSKKVCVSGKWQNVSCTEEKPSKKCEKGQSLVNGSCIKCPAGSYCPGDNTIHPCPSDKVSLSGATSLNECVEAAKGCNKNFPYGSRSACEVATGYVCDHNGNMCYAPGKTKLGDGVDCTTGNTGGVCGASSIEVCTINSKYTCTDKNGVIHNYTCTHDSGSQTGPDGSYSTCVTSIPSKDICGSNSWGYVTSACPNDNYQGPDGCYYCNSKDPTNPDDPKDPSNPTNPSNSNKPGPTPSNTSSNTPSSSSNITDNPKTGSVAIFIVWIIAIGTLVYAGVYFKQAKENN